MDNRAVNSKHNNETGRIEFETFRKIDPWKIGELTDSEPSCFNSRVSIRKYRVTIKEIEEPKSVLEARLRKLWVECDNHHNWQPLQSAAKELGITLSHDDRRLSRSKQSTTAETSNQK